MQRLVINWGGLVALMGLQVCLVSRLWPLLPERVAMHWGPNGQPDGWGSRDTLVLAMFASTGVFALVCHGAAAGIVQMPIRLINLPNKSYWLGPERNAESLRTLADFLVVFGHVSVCGICGLTQATLVANVGKPAILSGYVAVGIVAYALFTGGWVLALYRRFPRGA